MLMLDILQGLLPEIMVGQDVLLFRNTDCDDECADFGHQASLSTIVLPAGVKRRLPIRFIPGLFCC